MGKSTRFFLKKGSPYWRLQISSRMSNEEVFALLGELAYEEEAKSEVADSNDYTKPYIGQYDDNSFVLRPVGTLERADIIRGNYKGKNNGSVIEIEIEQHHLYFPAMILGYVLSQTVLMELIIHNSNWKISSDWITAILAYAVIGVCTFCLFLFFARLSKTEIRFWSKIFNVSSTKEARKLMINRIPYNVRHYKLG